MWLERPGEKEVYALDDGTEAERRCGWRRSATLRGWLERYDGTGWSAVPPGSLTIPADVRRLFPFRSEDR